MPPEDWPSTNKRKTGDQLARILFVIPKGNLRFASALRQQAFHAGETGLRIPARIRYPRGAPPDHD